MTGTELVTTIRAELNEDVAQLWTDPMFVKWINDGERDFVNRTRILEGVSTLSLQAGRLDYPIPTGCLSFKSVWVKVVNGDIYEWRRLWPTTLEKMGQDQSNPLQTAVAYRADPKKYWLWDRHIYVHPAPLTDGQLVQVFHKRKPTPLTALTDSLNVDGSMSDTIKAYVLWRAWSKEKEYDMAAVCKEEYFSGVRDGLRWVKKQTGDFVYSVDARSSTPISR